MKFFADAKRRMIVFTTLLSAAALSMSLVQAPAANAYDNQVRDGYVTDAGIVERPEVCGLPRGAKVKAQYKLDNGAWSDFDYRMIRANSTGCAEFHIHRMDLFPEGARNVSFRMFAPEQTVKRTSKKKVTKRIPVEETIGGVYGPLIDARTPTELATPVNDVAVFRDTYGDSVATIICNDPYKNESSQGSAVSVPIALSADAQQYGNTYLATAAHVVEGCTYTGWRSVSVLYQGTTYPGEVWVTGHQHRHDIASIVTTAPIPPAQLGINSLPVSGDAAIAIGTPSGIDGTVTQGQIAGVSRDALNLTTQSGPGASGGPVFNNRGELIGLVVAGNGSLTVAQALPTFCETIYTSDWSGCFGWNWPAQKGGWD